MNNNRKQKKSIADNTLKILEQGFYETPSGQKVDINEKHKWAVENTITYSPEMSDDLIKNRLPESNEFDTLFKVNGKTSMNATRELIAEGHNDVLCLNFASAKNPGGGFLGGSQAQEESIARASGLYPCLLKANEYYETNRKTKSCFYTDYMIYSPNVPIFKNEGGKNLDQLVTASFITAPAVNTGVVKHREPEKIGKIEEVMKRRIEKVLTIALNHNHKTLVLGAWGCGVFRNDPKEIAQYFKWVIEHKFNKQFKKIVFAVYSSNERFIESFNKHFA